jgi:hypothetical protein
VEGELALDEKEEDDGLALLFWQYLEVLRERVAWVG